jgi:hypothetical protein
MHYGIRNTTISQYGVFNHVKAIIKFGGNVIKFGKFSPVKLANFVYKFCLQICQAALASTTRRQKGRENGVDTSIYGHITPFLHYFRFPFKFLTLRCVFQSCLIVHIKSTSCYRHDQEKYKTQKQHTILLYFDRNFLQA